MEHSIPLVSMEVVSVVGEGRITIPARFREWKNIKKGDKIIIGVEKGKIVLLPLKEVLKWVK
ncbi:MAG TPA: AbrB/MazE/SpoVT family DNA-binding domain-containing protein [Archaeoglobus sp.]|nr:AbrB/MazE/SpoVT family DNA-binding domain-containing protein [Archaeoglobus sp.]